MATQPYFDFLSLPRDELPKILKQNGISLKPEEAIRVQQLVRRPLSLSECILWGIQGSEHCSYKSSRLHLKTLTTQGPEVVLGAKEDAGVVAVAKAANGDRYCIVMSHESHNHPSQIVPFEGAATGVGGNVRDVSCMGAVVIANADSLRFGDIQQTKTQWIHEEVVSGIASYSNALGVPNLAGDVYYHKQHNENCLVTVISLGVLREQDIIHSFAPAGSEGFNLILVGKPTDQSGFGGAAFASVDLEEADAKANRGAVQEPNAFLGQVLIKANAALFKKIVSQGLTSQVGFKDLGAGGISCATVEIAEAGGMGAEVKLDDVHTAMEGLHPTVILCSETQERYLWVASPEVTPLILSHYNEEFGLPRISQGARASVIGKIRSDGLYHVTYGSETLVNAKATDICKGIVYDRQTKAPDRHLSEPILPELDIVTAWSKLLQHENIASRKPVYEKYDKEVQGRTIIERGAADAGVMAPFNGPEYPSEIHSVGIALSVADNPNHGLIDPYFAGINAVVEAARKIVAVGAIPSALTDCLCFGNPEHPEHMHDFVRAIQGMKIAAETLTLYDHPGHALPIIAGNVSLYNETKKGPIPASPMISCLGKLSDVKKAITPAFKQSGSWILLVGDRKDECGGSQYYQLFDALGCQLPQPDLLKVRAELHGLIQSIERGLILACQAIHLGGLAIALSKMAIDGQKAFEVEISGQMPLWKRLFSETGGFVCEVAPEHVKAVIETFEKLGVHTEVIGKTTFEDTLHLNGHCLSLKTAAQLFENGLREKLT